MIVIGYQRIMFSAEDGDPAVVSREIQEEIARREADGWVVIGEGIHWGGGGATVTMRWRPEPGAQEADDGRE